MISHVVLICISLMANDIEQLFMCFFKFKFLFLFIYFVAFSLSCRIFLAACGIFHCGTQAPERAGSVVGARRL